MVDKREQLPSQREAVILSILVNGEKYGREIRNEYQKRTGRSMPIGALYTTLMRMEDYSLIGSRMGESSHERGGNRRKYFALRAAGVRALNAFEIFMAGAMWGTVS